MAILLKQSTASQEIPLGYFVDSADGNTEETALTIANTDIKLWKEGATTLANKNSGGATHISNGIYYATLDATDTNTLGNLIIFCHVTGALTVKVDCVVLPANVYDSLVAGTDNLQVDTIQWLGTACATPTVAGVPEVDVTHIGGDAQSATDLKDFADAGYDPATNKVEGVKLADTLTTYTGNTPQTADAGAIVSNGTYGNSALNAKLGTPAGVSVSADIAAVKSDSAAILADTAEIGAAGAGLTAIPWNAAWDAEVQSECADALAVYDPPTKAETDALLTTAMTESYATDGATMTPAQALYMIWAALSEFAISGTTITAKKLDGSTTAMTFTLDSATDPTSRTRVS